MKKFLALVLSLIMIAGLIGCGAKKEEAPAPAPAPSAPSTSAPADKGEEVVYDEIVISAASGFTEYVSAHAAWMLFEEIVEERSGGAMQVELYPNQQLGGDREFTEACAQGNVTMGSPSSSPAAAFCAALNVYDSPFIYADRETAYKALDSEAGKAILNAMEEANLKGLGCFENGFRNLTCNREINTLADLKGLKIRVMENDVHMGIWRALGANPSPLAFGELYTALQQGAFDAQENPMEQIYNTKFQEVQDHIYLTNHVYTPYIVFMNLDVWNGLNDASKALVQEAVDEAVAFQREQCIINEQECIDKINALDYSHVYPVSEELRAEMIAACAPVYDQVRQLAGEEITNNFYAACGFEG